MENPKHSPTFKAGGFGSALNLVGSTMQGIEDKGFLASFLVKDVLGMTAPRVGAAFLRDKDITGQYNMQEGFEVLGREGLTGPCMMAVAPISFAIAARFGKSTGINSQLIKRFGNSLKEIVKNPQFDKSLLNNKDKFKEEFYRININKMLESSLGKENVTKEQVEYILSRVKNCDKIPSDAELKGVFAKSNYRNSQVNEITEYINNLKYEKSSDLSMLNKVKFGTENVDSIKSFSIKDAIESMIKYSDDAISLNKNLDKLDEIMAEDIKNAAIAKRLMANIATISATLGVLSVLPKIYARSSVAPGAKTAMAMKEAKNVENNLENKDNAKDVTFKGRAPKPNKSWLSKIGEFISKHTTDSFSAEMEYNGHNFTPTLMAGLSLFGLLAPRGLRAYNRAQVDENGKKDLSELYEILIRDISSSLAVVFAVPMLTRGFVTAYENKSGFVLMQKDRTMSKWTQIFDLLNPYSKAHVLTNAEIKALYNSVDSKDKMMNFCKYISENNGDLEKILSKSENIKIFEDKGLNLKEISRMTSRDAKNTKIREFINGLGKDSDEIIAKVMKNAKKPTSNKILAFARNLNSLPGAIATFLISPYLLGWVIPRLTYANTRRLHEKAEQEKAEKSKINTAV